MDKYTVLKQVFGYSDFRPGQEELVDHILAGQDTLGIMPTGAGKSICFQVPALLMPGITLVVSPLVSLMKDQVGALVQSGVRAAYFNSSLTSGQYAKALANARQGIYKIIYVAPERLLQPGFIELSQQLNIDFLTVDEAHCISQWGQDFRPSYLQIADFLQLLPKRPVVAAFTATATQQVREDISRQLALRQPFTLTTGFDRPNLFFGVEKPTDKLSYVTDYLKKNKEKNGVIYCLTRKTVEQVCQNICDNGYQATRYHAGLSDAERHTNQDDFIYDRKKIMVATNAFGMGIDKSNVSFVLHYNMPKNLESYYQEAGRAGRDGEPAECILLYNGQDVMTNQWFIEQNRDNAELDPATRQLVMEQDRERLRQMTFYCSTNECLRDYILRYFGEYGENFCGNCSNCLTQFETVDVTETAKSILGCITACRQRYGAGVIVDTLHGANTAKLRQYGMTESPYYGLLAQVPVYQLRQVLNHLLLRGYLTATTDGYSILKLTAQAKPVLAGEESLSMKMAKEQPKAPKKAKKNKHSASLGQADEALFEQLRVLRMEIAKEEMVPPYVVFTDKTLVQMCRLKPQNKEEMLEVSGVGDHKYAKYGQQFLELILESQW